MQVNHQLQLLKYIYRNFKLMWVKVDLLQERKKQTNKIEKKNQSKREMSDGQCQSPEKMNVLENIKN